MQSFQILCLLGKLAIVSSATFETSGCEHDAASTAPECPAKALMQTQHTVGREAGPASRTKFVFAQDDNYPPYAERDANGELSGFGYDIAKGMTALCDDIEIEVVHAPWSSCWSSANGGQLGEGLENGEFDACMTYTHTQGIRNHFADFSYGILNVNKAAGLIVLLNETTGQPLKVDGQSDLDGIKVVDVGGWAPTADGIGYVENKCKGQPYSLNYEMTTAPNGNDEALRMLREGHGDAVFIYADQGYRFHKECEDPTLKPAWDCNLWKGFGKEYAYVQTGQFGYVVNGTTLALAKKGSGVVEAVNPCLTQFMQTQAYYDVCKKWDMEDSCYRNAFFPLTAKETPAYNQPTHEHVSGCDDGYCPCTPE